MNSVKRFYSPSNTLKHTGIFSVDFFGYTPNIPLVLYWLLESQCRIRQGLIKGQFEENYTAQEKEKLTKCVEVFDASFVLEEGTCTAEQYEALWNAVRNNNFISLKRTIEGDGLQALEFSFVSEYQYMLDGSKIGLYIPKEISHFVDPRQAICDRETLSIVIIG